MNRIGPHVDPTVLFVDMNSFFASCEQQVNFWLRGRPVGVCVYTGPHGCVIAPSIEAKRSGVKTGMRLDDAMRLCPDLVPIETHPNRYREYHVKIIDVLRRFSADVFPKSIDEAVVDLTQHSLLHPNPVAVAQQIKQAIRRDVGDYLKCSIGIAPNAFLAKLASDLQKPDGLTIITPDTIDDVLARLRLTDLPGIGHRMAARLEQGGIHTPLQLRHASPEHLRSTCQSIIGWHWHLRLNFGGEVDLEERPVKSMQAIRTISSGQRSSARRLDELLLSLCLTLERRMVRQDVFARFFFFSFRYVNDRHLGYEWKFSVAIQDGVELYRLIKTFIQKFEQKHPCEPVLNEYIRRMSVGVSQFITSQLVQYTLFEDSTRRDKLRKTYYDIKNRFGADKILRASELSDNPVMRDVIGFGSIRELPDLDEDEDDNLM